MSNTRVSIPIRNLSCGGGGSLLLERALSKVPGVSSSYVNPGTEIAYIEFDPHVVSIEALVRKIRLAGFGAGVPVIGSSLETSKA